MKGARRFVPLLVVVAIALAVNGYGAIVAYTFTTATVSAVVADCGVRGNCLGTWTNTEGETEIGRVAGTGSGDDGERFDVHVGPLGAYAAGWSTLWPRLIAPGIVDAGLVLAVMLVGYVVVRGRVSAARFAAGAAPGTGLYRIRKHRVDHADGRPYQSVTRSNGRSVDLATPAGLAWCRVRPDGTGGVDITRPDGTVLARLRCLTNAGEPVFTFRFTDAAGRPTAAMDISGLGSQLHRVLDPQGRELGAMVFTGFHGALVRTEPVTDDTWTLILIAAACVGNRLTTDAARL